jgi:hypothetical protein
LNPGLFFFKERKVVQLDNFALLIVIAMVFRHIIPSASPIMLTGYRMRSMLPVASCVRFSARRLFADTVVPSASTHHANSTASSITANQTNEPPTHDASSSASSTAPIAASTPPASVTPVERPGLNLTPKQVIAQLDRFIVGQSEAKRAVAIALRMCERVEWRMH